MENIHQLVVLNTGDLNVYFRSTLLQEGLHRPARLNEQLPKKWGAVTHWDVWVCMDKLDPGGDLLGRVGLHGRARPSR